MGGAPHLAERGDLLGLTTKGTTVSNGVRKQGSDKLNRVLIPKFLLHCLNLPAR